MRGETESFLMTYRLSFSPAAPHPQPVAPQLLRQLNRGSEEDLCNRPHEA